MANPEPELANETTPEQAFLSAEDVGVILGFTASTARRHLLEAGLPSWKFGRSRRWLRVDVDAWVSGQLDDKLWHGVSPELLPDLGSAWRTEPAPIRRPAPSQKIWSSPHPDHSQKLWAKRERPVDYEDWDLLDFDLD